MLLSQGLEAAVSGSFQAKRTPPLLVMTVVDRVVVHRSMSTLVLLSVILVITTLYETLLGYARRELVQVVSTRVDARLNLHIFDRLLGLPLDYFEKNPAGQINYRLAQVWKIRDFLTGKLMGTFLDMFKKAEARTAEESIIAL